MDVQQEIVPVESMTKGRDCHCSICFKEIDDAEAAAHSLAGRYYCNGCRAIFREKSLGGSGKPSTPVE